MPAAGRRSSLRAMARKAGRTDDYDNAARLGLTALTADADVSSIGQLATLHPRNDTFPAEVLLELAAEAIEESGASPADPINYEGILDRFLPSRGPWGLAQKCLPPASAGWLCVRKAFRLDFATEWLKRSRAPTVRKQECPRGFPRPRRQT